MSINVTPQDIRDSAYGLIIPAGADAAIAKVVSKAIDRVLDAFPSIEDRIVTGAIPATRVSGVVEDMVIRVLRNPNAYRQVSIDDYSRMVDTAVSSGSLYISTDERAMLTPKARRPRIGSIRLGVPSHRIPRA